MNTTGKKDDSSGMREGALILLAVFGQQVFYCLSSAANVSHNSVLFQLFNVVLALIVSILFFKDFLGGQRYPISVIVFLIVLCFAFVSFLKDGGVVSSAQSQFSFFLVWGMPAALAGLYLSTGPRWANAIRFFDVIWPILALGVVCYTIRSFFLPWELLSETGLNYQVASYCAALAFGLAFSSLVCCGMPDCRKFSFASSGLFKTVAAVCLPVMLLCSVVSGGRGGLALILLFTAGALGWYCLRRHNVLPAVIAVIAALLIASLLLHAEGGDAPTGGLSRLLATGSGREGVYALATEAFLQRPVFGYGYFGYMDLLDGYIYPHNLVLQLLLSFGIAGAVPVVALIAYLLYKGIALLRMDESYLFLAVIFAYSLVYLFFSGSFLYCAPFMFAVAYLLNAPCDIAKPKKPKGI